MRIHCPPENIAKNKITIFDKGEIHHLSDVLRLKAGNGLCIFDGQSKEYGCVIDTIAKDKVTLTINSIKKISDDKRLRITLACSIPKKAKIEHIIEKAAELGVDNIIPLQTERSVVRISPEKAQNKLKRWQAIAKEASKQCGRITLPVIEPIALFQNAVKRAREYDLALIPYLGEKNRDIKEAVNNFSRRVKRGGLPLKAQKCRSIIVFIGPEGDFSEAEIRLAKACGCIGVSLGELTLKVDTAAIAVMAFLRFSWK